MPDLLEIARLRAGYGAINVLWDVALTIPERAVTVIVGPNGAGKTTLLRALTGLIAANTGTIRFAGADLARLRPWERVAAGLVMIPEGRLVFADMSVDDNLRMGAFPRACRANMKRNREMVFDLFPRLRERQRQMAGTLSGGEAQMLAIGRGLMEQPRLCLIDEPSLGLSPVMVAEIFAILAKLKGEGLSMVLVEQNTAKALEIADQVHLMQNGKVVFSEAADKVDLDRLHDLYFARGAA